MKVFYNSIIAKALTFMSGFKTIMFLGMVFTEESELSGKTLEHEKTHCLQYKDCFNLGLFIAVILFFVLLGFDILNWWSLLLFLIPLLLFYAWYGVEYIVWRFMGLSSIEAYRKIGFERQARWCAETWDMPCEKQNHYEQFGWYNII